MKNEVWVLCYTNKITMPISFHTSESAAKLARNQFLMTNKSLKGSDITYRQAEINGTNASSSADKLKMFASFENISDEQIHHSFHCVPRERIVASSIRYHYMIHHLQNEIHQQNHAVAPVIGRYLTVEEAEKAIGVLFPAGGNYSIAEVMTTGDLSIGWLVKHHRFDRSHVYQFNQSSFHSGGVGFSEEKNAISFCKLKNLSFEINGQWPEHHGLGYEYAVHADLNVSRMNNNPHLIINVRFPDLYNGLYWLDYQINLGEWTDIEAAYNFCRMYFQGMTFELELNLNTCSQARDYNCPKFAGLRPLARDGGKELINNSLIEIIKQFHASKTFVPLDSYFVANADGTTEMVSYDRFRQEYLSELLSMNTVYFGGAEKLLVKAMFDQDVDYMRALRHKETGEWIFTSTRYLRGMTAYQNNSRNWVLAGYDPIKQFLASNYETMEDFAWSDPERFHIKEAIVR